MPGRGSSVDLHRALPQLGIAPAHPVPARCPWRPPFSLLDGESIWKAGAVDGSWALGLALGHVRNAVVAFVAAEDPSGESLFLAAECLELEGLFAELGVEPELVDAGRGRVGVAGCRVRGAGRGASGGAAGLVGGVAGGAGEGRPMTAHGGDAVGRRPRPGLGFVLAVARTLRGSAGGRSCGGLAGGVAEVGGGRAAGPGRGARWSRHWLDDTGPVREVLAEVAPTGCGRRRLA